MSKLGHSTHTVPNNQKPQFLNRYALQVFAYVASKSKAKKAILSGDLMVNGKRVAFDSRVFPGDVITLKEKSVSNKKGLSKVFEEKIEVVFEDEHMAVLNKPGGLPVNGNSFKTLENTLPYNLKTSKEKDALAIMRPLHRLDGPTCGLVLVAKTERAQVIMGQQFEKKTIRKRYKAVVIGKLKESKGVVNEPIDKKPSQSEFEVVESSVSEKYKHLTLLNLFPITGRTHQLRIHMSGLGHPVVGDKFYAGDYDVLSGKGLLLCSDKVWFKHPITEKPIEVEIKMPNKFNAVMKREADRFKRLNA